MLKEFFLNLYCTNTGNFRISYRSAGRLSYDVVPTKKSSIFL